MTDTGVREEGELPAEAAAAREEGELPADDNALLAMACWRQQWGDGAASPAAAVQAPESKKRKRARKEARVAACHAHLRGVCALGAACAYSHAAPPCAEWAASACHRGAFCSDVHAGPPGRQPALPAQPRAFTAEQASRFRALIGSPDASSRLGELRALVGPLIVPLQPGAVPEAAAATAAVAAELQSGQSVHAANCGCPACQQARPAAGDVGCMEAEAARIRDVLSAAGSITATKSRAMWVAVLEGIRLRRQ